MVLIVLSVYVFGIVLTTCSITKLHIMHGNERIVRVCMWHCSGYMQYNYTLYMVLNVLSVYVCGIVLTTCCITTHYTWY